MLLDIELINQKHSGFVLANNQQQQPPFHDPISGGANIALPHWPVGQSSVARPLHPLPNRPLAAMSNAMRQFQSPNSLHPQNRSSSQSISGIPHKSSNVCGQPSAPPGRKQPYTNSTPLHLPNSLLDLSLPGTIPSGCGAHHPRNPAHKQTTDTENADDLQDAGRKYELNIYFLLFISSLSCHSIIPSRSGFPLVQGASILCTRPSPPSFLFLSINCLISSMCAGGKHNLHPHSATTP
ncbi:hypothetical protein PtA15_2A628 [Puccinia triticina]|uniref:Uncharacterized protein n=1 Tax=Puccinia triticina TaxID=208348 RepID=A0ABY7CAV5_9BASI|nr:uncharacterized protein PtA15_2A628 [Puccinia triticina]WAQ82311.1 hypothetical protein PtA15_2A628 [Puccinia triticina]